jgi:hypothetical protein
MNQAVLSSFHFGSVEHYRLLAGCDRVLIDIGEHYERQSFRTRTSIAGPNGVHHLTVPVLHDHGSKTPMREVRVSHAEAWPQKHVHAIRSAYGNTPWFIHYIDAIEELYLTEYVGLADLNMASLRLGMRWLGLNTLIEVSTAYVEQPTSLDLRASLHPKRPLPQGITPVGPYPQVFADRLGFVGRMSVIDLVCNCGPQSARIIRA